jgi:hypothetical protein
VEEGDWRRGIGEGGYGRATVDYGDLFFSPSPVSPRAVHSSFPTSFPDKPLQSQKIMHPEKEPNSAMGSSAVPKLSVGRKPLQLKKNHT